MNTPLPTAYRETLRILALPKMVAQAIRLYGIIEGPGRADNPLIMSWAKELGLTATYSNDAVPWCGLFMSIVAHRAGYTPPAKPLWAFNWRNFGNPVEKPMLGDILIKSRKTSTGAIAGHVTLVLGEDATHYHCLGGNQGDAVTISRISKKSQLWFRRPPYKVQPASVKTYLFAADAATAGGTEA